MLALTLVIGLVPAVAGAAPMYEIGVEFPVALAPNGQIQPDIDFPWIVWKDNRGCIDDEEEEVSDIYAYNFVTGEERQVTDWEGCESNPSISGDWVVFSWCIRDWNDDNDDYSSVWAVNLATGEEKMLAESWDDDNEFHVGNPAIEGSMVVFNHWDYTADPYDGDIWFYDLETDDTGPLNAKDGHQWAPEIGDGWVVYRESVPGGWQYNNVLAYDLESEEEITIAEGVYTDGVLYVDMDGPSTDDGKVVYSRRTYNWSNWSYEICLYDIATDTTTVISSADDSANRQHPVINDGLVTWHDRRIGVYEVYGYDLAAEEEFVIVPAVWDDDASDWISYAGRTTTADGIVAWHDHRDEGYGDEDWEDLYAMFLRSSEVVLAGENRYTTAVDVSKANFPYGADQVIIATGENFPDALAGSSLAGLYNAPILLVGNSVLPAVAEEIERLGATDAIVLGREKAVPLSVDGELAALGLDVTRLGGEHRFETAKLIAEEAVGILGDDWDGSAFLATGYNWPDALSAGPLSAATGWPIFLGGPEGDPITDYTAGVMDDLGVDDVYVLGGPAVISLGAADGMSATALAGETRYETAVAIAEFGVDEIGLSMGSLAIATGEKYPDALTAGPAQGIAGGSLLITPAATTSPAIMDAIEANADTITLVKFIGGLQAITQSVRDAIMALL
jgi:putative cell wall-binding protein